MSRNVRKVGKKPLFSRSLASVRHLRTPWRGVCPKGPNMPYIDFDRFHQMVSLEATIKALGLTEPRRFRPWRRSFCPICRHPDRRAFYMNWKKSSFYCHRCCRGGGPLQLASAILAVDVVKAALELCRRLCLDVPVKLIVTPKKAIRDASGEKHDGEEEDEALQ